MVTMIKYRTDRYCLNDKAFLNGEIVNEDGQLIGICDIAELLLYIVKNEADKGTNSNITSTINTHKEESKNENN